MRANNAMGIHIEVDEECKPRYQYLIPAGIYNSMLVIAELKRNGEPWEEAAHALLTTMYARRSEFGAIVSI